ncbi:MAG: aspartate kinase [Candidatus Paceibacterota bacterium]
MTKKIIVNKFGGGILKKELIPIIALRLKEQLGEGYSPIVVVSAMPGITDSLVSFLIKLKEKPLKKNEVTLLVENYIIELKKIHSKIITDMEFNKEWRNEIHIELEKLFFELEKDLNNILSHDNLEDKIVSYGEKFSATILSFYFNLSSINTKRLLAEEIPIITDDNFKNANIEYKLSEKNIKDSLLKIKEVPVIAGFTGITKNGETTTLGRGGTDTTACFVGAALKAHKIILWKDVGGVLSADPKIVPHARVMPTISYQEAEESGKIIHEKAIDFVKMHKTPIDITSLSNPKFFTQIKELKTHKKGTKLISSKKNLTLFIITDEKIKTNEQLNIVTGTFAKYKTEMILVSNTRHSLQVVADNSNGMLDHVFKEIESKVHHIKAIPVNMIFLVGNFDVKDVNKFNDLLIKMKTGLQISAFLYENCTRMEAVVETNKIDEIIRVLYKKFIK